jgi:arginase
VTRASVVVVPQWQGCAAPSASGMADGARRLAGLVTRAGRAVVEVDLPAGTSARRAGVDAYDVLLDARAGIAAGLPAGPVLAIGGDCGADLAVAARGLAARDGDLALVWIDAHADFNTPATSPSGAFHGMVLRALTGAGAPGLVAGRPADPSQLVLVGTRSVDPAEQRDLDASGVRWLDPADPSAVARALRATGCSAVHVHLDLDVLDPGAFPHTLYPVPGGPGVAQVIDVLAAVDDTLPVVSAFVGEHAGGTAADVDVVAPLVRRLLDALDGISPARG